MKDYQLTRRDKPGPKKRETRKCYICKRPRIFVDDKCQGCRILTTTASALDKGQR